MGPAPPEERSVIEIEKSDTAPIVPSFDSRFDDLSKLWTAGIQVFRQIDDLIERWRAQEAETVKKVSAVLEKLPLFFELLAGAVADLEQDIHRTIERSAELGHSGWTVSLWMTRPEAKALCEFTTVREMNQFMLDWYDAYDSDLRHIEARLLKRPRLNGFHVALSQCFSAYRRGEYAITLPCLVAILEGALRALAPDGPFASTKIERLIKQMHQKAKEKEAESITVSIWASVLAFVTWFYEQYEAGKASDDRIFRHGLQHGTQLPPNEKIEPLRLFHALDTVTRLYFDDGA
jgi:hypothetical protein